MNGIEDVIRAGGIAPGQPPPAMSEVDAITARSYRHPVLDGRVVVRLVPAALGPAEDLAAEFLGLASAAEPVHVGAGLRQALGFPAWALVHDPGNGRHALAMVKDMERLARMAKAKPGNAKDGYDVVAARLDAAAPHFLPTFWEQAGRAFLAADNPKAAGVCFGRARDAELTHALAVDENRIATVHLEFALAGGLPAKAVSQYARELAARCAPAEAYERFRAVARQRIAGGLPPHAGLGEDLTRLARAAGHPVDVEADRFVAEVLALPAVTKAAFGFWKFFTKPLTRLTAQDATVRRHLLAIVPDPIGREDVTDAWIAFLNATGATASLIDPDDTTAGPGGAGGWLERISAGRLRRGWRTPPRSAALLGLVARMIPRLRAEARPLRLLGEYVHGTDLDLLDLCLGAGLDIAPPRDHVAFNVSAWLDDAAPGGRDLVAVATHSSFRMAFREGAIAALQQRHRGPDTRHLSARDVHRITASAGVRVALADWFEDLAEQTHGATLVTLTTILAALNPLHSAEGMAVSPAPAARLARADVAAALALTLRTGLADEFGWPAYNEAVRLLDGKNPITTLTSWPYVTVQDGFRAITVGPNGIALDHTFRIPGGPSPLAQYRPTATYVDGQLLVQWYSQGQYRAYWSGRPDDVFPMDGARYHGTYHQHLGPTMLHLAGGGVTTGQKSFHAGDTAIPDRQPLASDGTSFWRLEAEGTDWRNRTWRWRQFHPVTGAAGRYSTPAFFDVAGVVAHRCMLVPAPDAFANSPLGHAIGLVGWRVRTGPDGTAVGEGVDGRTLTCTTADLRHGYVAGALSVPGSDRLRAVTVNGSTVDIWTETGDQPASRNWVGQRRPPFEFWHATRPRDETGSAALRAITSDLARQAIESVRAVPDDDRYTHAYAEVARLLPALTDATLRRQVALTVCEAAGCADTLDRLGGYAAAPVAVPVAAAHIEAPLLGKAMAAVARSPWHAINYHQRYRQAPEAATATQILAVGRVLAGENPAPGDLAGSDTRVDWARGLDALRALALRAASPATDEEERQALLAMLSTVVAAGLADTGGRLRLVDAVSTFAAFAIATDAVGHVLRAGPHRVGVTVQKESSLDYTTRIYTEQVEILERDDTGTFGPIEGYDIVRDLRPAGWEPQRLLALCERVRADGPAPWRAELVTSLVERTGVSRGEAAMLLGALPNVTSREANFLPPATRALLGLTATEARGARDTLRAMPAAVLSQILGAAMPDDPADLWHRGPDVVAMAAAWSRLVGQRVTVDENIIVDAGRLIPARSAAAVIRGLSDPRSWPWLAGPAALHQSVTLKSVVVALTWLPYRTAAGDGIRVALPTALRMLRERLTDPDFSVEFHGPDTDPGLPAVSLVDKHSVPGWSRYRLSPHLLTGPDDPALAIAHRPELTFVLSDRPAALMEFVAAENGRPGCWYQDPRMSTPDTVDSVAERHGLSPDAAAYYLQLLTLPDPTDRHVLRWNGWSAAELKRVRAELSATSLVVTAKRERAGRVLFLPGGWLPLRAPDLPLESWKTAHLGLAADGTARLGVVVVDRPVPDLLRAAWQRVLDGDEPRFASLGDKP